MAKVAEFEKLGAGLGIRFVVVLACVALLFMQKPPAPKVGAPRRYARNPKTIILPMKVIGAVLFFSGVGLLIVGTATGDALTYGYPIVAAICLGCGFIGGQLRASTVPVEGRLKAEKVRIDKDYSIVLNAEAGTYVNVPNPFRGTLVLGGAGAGKTYSIGEPFLEQFLQKGMCGIIYDFKFPVLAGAAQKALLYAQPAHQKLLAEYAEAKQKGVPNFTGLRKPIRHRVINFLDMERTEKVNPLRPQDMPTQAYAMEYAQTILTNLSPAGAKGGDNFFTKSAEAYLTAIIWYYRNNYPALCTVPHVVATAVYKDFTHVLHMLSEDPSSEVLAQSLITAVKQGAEKQIAGIVASLQVDLAKLATPEISWVLSPDEDPRLGDAAEGFSLNLNDPNNPTLLTIGNDPTLAKTFSPVISCVIAVALKLMNQQYKHPSFVLIDEGATIYVPGLETIPATARSNKVAMLYMTQDMAQLNEAYGKDKAQVLVSNLNNQFFGKVNSGETAQLISNMIGKEEAEVVSVSTGHSMGGHGSSNKGQSVSIQEKQVVRIQDAYTLRQGEFIGQTVETKQTFFMAQMEREVEPGNYPIEVFTHFAAAKGVVDSRIREKVEQEIAADSVIKNRELATRTPAKELRARSRSLVKAKERAEYIGKENWRPAGIVNPEVQALLRSNTHHTVNTTHTVQLGMLGNTYLGVEASNTGNTGSLAGDEVELAEEPDYAWDAQTVNAPQQGPQYKPSAAEALALQQRAAAAQHERNRTRRTPDAATNDQWLTEAERHEAAEKLAAQQAEDRARERTTQLTDKDRPTQTVLADMIVKNHERVRGEVEKAILNSGENSLSKEGLAKAAAVAKNKAGSTTEGKY